MIVSDGQSLSFRNTTEVEAFSRWYLSERPVDTAEFDEAGLAEFIKKRDTVLKAQLFHLSELKLDKCIHTSIEDQSYYRIVPAAVHRPLNAEGSLKSNSRFNYKNVPLFHNRAVYFGQDRECCYLEKFHLDIQKENYAKLFNRTAEQVADELPRPRYLLKEYRLKDINRIAVLTSEPTFRALSVPVNVARDEWYPTNDQWEIPTSGQILGRILREAGYNGIMYTSVRMQSKNNLVLFEENLGRLDFQEVSSVDLDLAP